MIGSANFYRMMVQIFEVLFRQQGVVEVLHTAQPGVILKDRQQLIGTIIIRCPFLCSFRALGRF
jgi:hypothetical protein